MSPHPTPPLIRIEDPEDPRVARFVGLRDRELRAVGRHATPRGRGFAAATPTDLPADGWFVAESDLVVSRALRAGYELEALLVDAARVGPLPDGLPPDAVVYGAGRRLVQRITGLGVHRGSIAVFRRRPERTPAEVLDNARRVVVAETLVNPINLGVIARTAAALGMDGLLLDDHSADPLYRRASRVAMGEIFAFPWARIGALPAGLAAISERGFRTLALTPAADAVDLDTLEIDGNDRIALVLGSEGPGLTAPTMAACDQRVRIPLAPGVDSLNVAAAAAIACWTVRP